MTRRHAAWGALYMTFAGAGAYLAFLSCLTFPWFRAGDPVAVVGVGVVGAILGIAAAAVLARLAEHVVRESRHLDSLTAAGRSDDEAWKRLMAAVHDEDGAR